MNENLAGVKSHNLIGRYPTVAASDIPTKQSSSQHNPNPSPKLALTLLPLKSRDK